MRIACVFISADSGMPERFHAFRITGCVEVGSYIESIFGWHRQVRHCCSWFELSRVHDPGSCVGRHVDEHASNVLSLSESTQRWPDVTSTVTRDFVTGTQP